MKYALKSHTSKLPELKMEHKLQEISPIECTIRWRIRAKKSMTHSMDLKNKPAAPERAIPEKDKAKNEKLEMAHKLPDRPLSPVKRKQRPDYWAKKNMIHSMDLHSKPAALEEAIPENDKHENENLEMRENMAKRAKILTKVKIQTCSIASERVVDLLTWYNMDMHSKPATPEKTMPKIILNERESLFVTFDLESTGETPFFFSFLAVIALFWRNV